MTWTLLPGEVMCTGVILEGHLEHLRKRTREKQELSPRDLVFRRVVESAMGFSCCGPLPAGAGECEIFL